MTIFNRTIATAACAAVAIGASLLASSGDAAATGFGAGAGPANTVRPIVRDHRTPAPAPVVRDHRGGQVASGGVTVTPTGPIVRDHRGEGPIVRDHRGEGPIVRDHRGEGPIVRDHRHPVVTVPPVVKPPVVRPPGIHPPVKPPVANPNPPSGPGVIVDPCRGNGCKPPMDPGHHHPPKHAGSGGFSVSVSLPEAVDTCTDYEYRRETRYVPGIGAKLVLVKVCVTE